MTTEKLDISKRRVADLRSRLLDLTARNRLLNYRHSERARTHVRIIDELPDILHAKLLEGRTLAFKSLPQPDEDPPRDERSETFQTELDAAMETDGDYLQELDQLEEGSEGRELRRIERALRDRVRTQLHMADRRRSLEEVPSIGDYARECGLIPSYDVPRPETVEMGERHQDNELQTLLLPEDMDRKLQGLYSSTGTILGETGVNTLYVAFGFLEWREANQASKAFHAPLLLQQIILTRQTIRRRYRYSIQWTGDDAEINITLKRRLESDFNLLVPEFIEDDTPEAYLSAVEDLVSDNRDWRVRRFMTVGQFAFHRIVMYNDLEHEDWGADGIHAKSVVADLLGGVEQKAHGLAEIYDLEKEPAKSKVPPLIMDADSSLISAIIDSLDEKDIAIQGPPGTGKSQTIANLIAAAMYRGKTVLFLAEKVAALDVVKSHLDHTGLGDFCLELHATKANKKSVLETLKKRDEIQNTIATPEKIDQRLEEIEKLKKRISDYVETLNKPFGSLNVTVQNILWLEQIARTASESLPELLQKSLKDLSFTDPASVTESIRSQNQDLMRTIEEVYGRVQSAYGSAAQQPWYGLNSGALSPFDVETLLKHLSEARDSVTELENALSSCRRDYGVQISDTLSGAKAWSTVTDLISASGFDADGQILMRLADHHGPVVERAKSLQLRYHEKDEMLANYFNSTDGLGDRYTLVMDLSSDVRAAQAGNGTLSSLSQDIQNLERLNAASAAAESLAKNLVSACGLSEEITPGVLRPLLRLVSVLRETDRKTLLLRSPSVMEELSRDTLVSAKTGAEQVKNELQMVNETIEVSITDTPEDYQRAANVLREAGLLAFMSGAVRAAKAFCRARMTDARVERSTMQKRLEGAYVVLRRVREFMQQPKLAAICGPNFDGLDTDFEALLHVNSYARDVRNSFTSMDPATQVSRRILLEGSVEQIDHILSLMDRPEAYGTVQSMVENATAGDVSLSAIIIDMRARSVSLQRIMNQAHRLGVLSTVSLGQIPEAVEALNERENIREQLADDVEIGPLLGVETVNPSTSLHHLEESWGLLQSLIAAKLPDAAINYVRSDNYIERLEHLQMSGDLVRSYNKNVQNAIDAFANLAELDFGAFFGKEELGETTPDELISRMSRALEAEDDLQDWLTLRRAIMQSRDSELHEIIASYDQLYLPYEDLVQAYEFVFFRSLAQKAFQIMPILNEFSGASLDAARERFRRLDKELITLQRKLIASQLSRRSVAQGNAVGSPKSYTERALIRHEIAKKKRHIPVRALVSRAGSAIQQMTPCLMMSPLSVAQFLPPNVLEFDLLVIDEASQVRPEDALGAVARSRQIVVVGDPKLLPPTSFFDRDAQITEELDEEEAVDTESILDLALERFQPSRNLVWHYRSRHQSLIAYSNRHFYGDRLIVFPSPLDQREDFGVRYRQVDGEYKSRLNLRELDAIADAALDFMRKNPDRSLGLVTMNKAQADLLDEKMDRLIGTDPQASAYRERWLDTLEPFFVKNLENVQGDERDAIFISTVYGADRDTGRVYQRFGPINSRVGHRRLNVLFTRAKEQVVVFSSLKPGDIIVGENSYQGLKAFAGYLDYAATGHLERGERTGREPDSPFEEWLIEALKDKGYSVEPQIGVAGYFIDIGVRHPSKPDGYILGVEADGAAYHSSKSARDRDRLRQEILEALGWEIYRVWSTDWFANPRQELAKLVRHIEKVASEENRAVAGRVPNGIGRAPNIPVSDETEDTGTMELPLAPTDEGHNSVDVECPVEIGDRVELAFEDEPERHICVLLNSKCHDPENGLVHVSHAFGEAVMGARVGDEVEIEAGDDTRRATILRVIKSH